jgi:uncharacterized alkaline shock family protein YloU
VEHSADSPAQPIDPRASQPRAIGQIIRRAAASSYGVVAVSGPRWYHGLLARLGLGTPGVRVTTEPRLRVALYLALAPGVPVAQVASNVEKAVRYVIQRDLGRSIDELAIHVGGVLVASAGGKQGSLGET